jgi:hypothetical protein
MKTRVFISFTIPFDLEARNSLYSDSLRADSGFSISAWSVRPGQLRERWEQDTLKQIGDAEVIVALVGAHTTAASNVRDEVEMARRLGKTVFAVRIDDHPDPPDNLSELLDRQELECLLGKVRAC